VAWWRHGAITSKQLVPHFYDRTRPGNVTVEVKAEAEDLTPTAASRRPAGASGIPSRLGLPMPFLHSGVGDRPAIRTKPSRALCVP
jgi:hypothetical protein